MKTVVMSMMVAAGAMGLCGCAASTGPTVVNTASGTPYRGKVFVNTDKDGVALEGHDPVSFFTDGKPVKGDARFESAYKGAVYRFASAEHKAMFDATPAKYEPQFGGWCGYAASINKVSPVDVKYAEIVDGRLVLQHNQKAWDLWHQDVSGNLKKAGGNWPGLTDANGR